MALRHARRGILFALCTICCAALLMIAVIAGTWNSLENMAENGEVIDLHALFASAFSGIRSAEVYLLPLLFLCWLISVVDAGILGKQLDVGQRVKTHTSDHGV